MVTNHINIVTSNELNIKPNNINRKQHFFGAFGHNETEVSASWIVKLCQKNGGWKPFTSEEIESLYNEVGYKNFTFNNLIKGGFIIEDKQKFWITDVFILRCALSAYIF